MSEEGSHGAEGGLGAAEREEQREWRVLCWTGLAEKGAAWIVKGADQEGPTFQYTTGPRAELAQVWSHPCGGNAVPGGH